MKRKKEFFDILTELQKDFSFNIFDCFSLFNDEKEYFVDHAHLNFFGAQEFTKFFNKIIDSNLCEMSND